MVDNTDNLICPACGKPMKKIYIKAANCNIDVCLDGCGGVYFDNREFKKMDENLEDIHELTEAYLGKTFEKADETKDRYCPCCKAKMTKHYASAKHEIEIDDCYNCGAIFLDGSELYKIRDQFKTEKDRAEHFNSVFMAGYNNIFKELDERCKINEQQRSLTKKLFDKVFYALYCVNEDELLSKRKQILNEVSGNSNPRN